jgi:hypothetical protein
MSGKVGRRWECIAPPARKRREIELVAICHDKHAGGLALSVTLSHHTRGLIRETFSHDDTPGGLADALAEVAGWIRSGAL